MEIYEFRGVEGLVYAEVLTDTTDAEGYSTGPVKELAGVAEIGKSTESSSESHYYDNKPAIVVSAEGADEVTLTVSAIPLEVLADITGKMYDATTGAMIDCQGERKYFAIGYKTKDTNGREMYVWRLKGQFSIPDETYATEDDGTDANGQELTYTGIYTTHAFTKGGPAKSVTVDVAKDLVDVATFFDQVTTPDDLTPKEAG